MACATLRYQTILPLDKVLSFDYAYVIGGKVGAHIYKVSTSSIYPKRIPPNDETREKKKEQEYKGLLSPRSTTHNPKTVAIFV